MKRLVPSVRIGEGECGETRFSFVGAGVKKIRLPMTGSRVFLGGYACIF